MIYNNTSYTISNPQGGCGRYIETVSHTKEEQGNETVTSVTGYDREHDLYIRWQVFFDNTDKSTTYVTEAERGPHVRAIEEAQNQLEHQEKVDKIRRTFQFLAIVLSLGYFYLLAGN